MNDPAVQAFADKLAEKSAAKEKVLEAIAGQDWAGVNKHGLKGAEGKCMDELQAMADAYVREHPEQFVNVTGYVNPEGLGQIVRLIDLYRAAGMEEEALKLTMFELASFERQTIGVAARAKVRIGNGG